MHCLLANNECFWLQFLHKYGPFTWDLDIDFPINLSSDLDDLDGNIDINDERPRLLCPPIASAKVMPKPT